MFTIANIYELCESKPKDYWAIVPSFSESFKKQITFTRNYWPIIEKRPNNYPGNNKNQNMIAFVFRPKKLDSKTICHPLGIQIQNHAIWGCFGNCQHPVVVFALVLQLPNSDTMVFAVVAQPRMVELGCFEIFWTPKRQGSYLMLCDLVWQARNSSASVFAIVCQPPNSIILVCLVVSNAKFNTTALPSICHPQRINSMWYLGLRCNVVSGNCLVYSWQYSL